MTTIRWLCLIGVILGTFTLVTCSVRGDRHRDAHSDAQASAETTQPSGRATPSDTTSTSLPQVDTERLPNDHSALGRSDTAADQALDAFLAAHRAAFDASRRPVARIALAPMAEDDVRVSKVGGRPYWPAHAPFPVPPVGARLFLLAQINFAELPQRMPGYPERGLLQFFIADDDLYGAAIGEGGLETQAVQKGFRVVYWPDPSAPARAWPQPLASDRLPHDPTQPRRMTFTIETETLSIGDWRFDRDIAADLETAVAPFAQRQGVETDAVTDAAWERLSASGHKLGGYPFFTQSDPRDHGDYELLFQLDSDDAMMWGDVGVAHFFIRPSDLVKADFGRVVYNWDCH